MLGGSADLPGGPRLFGQESPTIHSPNDASKERETLSTPVDNLGVWTESILA